MDVYFILTEKCNYHCDFCIRRSIPPNFEHDITFEKFCKAVVCIHDMFPDSTLILTGGEPFLHPDYQRIVRFSTNLFDRVVITSNGSFDNDTADFLIPFLKTNLYIQISLDGTRIQHDRMRGEGAYNKVISSLENLKAASSHLALSSTVRKGQMDQVKQLAVNLNHFQFAYWKISPEQVGKPSLENIISSSEWNDFVMEILPLCHFRVHIKKMFAFNIWDYHLQSLTKEAITYNNNCGWGKRKLYVLPNGDILACTCLNDRVGNIFTDSASCIIKNIQDTANIEVDKNSICYSCKYKPICNGGCPGYSQKVFGQKNMGDIRCPFVSSFLLNKR